MFMKGKPFDDPYGQYTDHFLSDLRDNFGPYLARGATYLKWETITDAPGGTDLISGG